MIGEQRNSESRIRECDSSDANDVLAIINAAAAAYRGVIPPDRWHEPYMRADELTAEVADGVVFNGIEASGRLLGVMGVQRRQNVDLVRHAYVLPKRQGQGIGSRLLQNLRRGVEGPILIGTWAAAEWAIRFYERHGFARVARHDVAPLLSTYWKVPKRQIDTSVVLASPPMVGDAAARLIAAAKNSE